LDAYAYPGIPYLIWYSKAGDWFCRAFSLSESGYREFNYSID
jgi:hypothetical protein